MIVTHLFRSCSWPRSRRWTPGLRDETAKVFDGQADRHRARCAASAIHRRSVWRKARAPKPWPHSAEVTTALPGSCSAALRCRSGGQPPGSARLPPAAAADVLLEGDAVGAEAQRIVIDFADPGSITTSFLAVNPVPR
jgi:hypothetical protein